MVDAVRRRAEPWWLLVILVFPTFGALAYFLVVKVHDFDLGPLRRALGAERRPKLEELSYRAIETPSVANKLAYAEALAFDARYAEASEQYRDVLRRDSDNKKALHGLSRCLLGLDKPAEACEHLQRLLEADNQYADYGAALDYAEALWQSGQTEETIELLQGLVGVSSRINHRLALAHYLTRKGSVGAARDMLEHALRDYEHSPAFVKRRDRKWAERGEKMLRELA